MKRFFARVFRFFWSWGFLKFVLFAITLIILLYAEEDWRGARAWAATKAKWEARGVSFDFSTYLPPPVPDDQNLAAIPLFKLEPDPDPDPGRHGMRTALNLHKVTFQKWNAQTDANPMPGTIWQGGEVTDMNKFRRGVTARYNATFPGQSAPENLSAQMATLFPFIGQLREESSKRRFCQFDQNYDFDSPGQNLTGQVTAQILVSRYLTYDAIAALNSGKPDTALDDIKLNTKLTRGLIDQPILVSGLCAVGMTAINFGSVCDGLTHHAWNDAQLADLESNLTTLDYLSDYHRLMRGEAVGVLVPAIDRILKDWSVWLPDSKGGAEQRDYVPSLWANGWIELWKAQSVDFGLTASDWADPKARVFLPKAMADYRGVTEKRLDSWTIYLPWNWLFRMGATGPILSAPSKFAQMQVWVDEARIGCALERYRLAHGMYPPTLDALAPIYINELPHDVMDGDPYHYRPKPDGSFLLYSVGWNQVDDGGKEIMRKDVPQLRDYTQGDWVWPTAKE